MPQHYKAVTEHKSIDYDKDLRSIARYFRGKGDNFRAIFDRWKLCPLEDDDVGALVEQVARRLIEFALDCDAQPMRTPRKLMPTIIAIGNDPANFVENCKDFDPEAVELIFLVFVLLQQENRMRLLLFEAGIVPSLPVEGIAQAAGIVFVGLIDQAEHDAHVGGQHLELRAALVRDLAKLFEEFGGAVKLSTRLDPTARDGFSYEGPFHDFLDLVLPIVMPFAAKAGFKKNSTRSMVTSLLKERRTNSMV